MQLLAFQRVTALWVGWILDRILGDPPKMPHLIVGFGHLIGWGEKQLNHGNHRRQKGALMAIFLILFAYLAVYALLHFTPIWLSAPISYLLVYYCLAGTTLIKEVAAVFKQLEISLQAGRNQLSRIVGRDTSELSKNECKTAALETLSENLSDGVIAPLFWFALLGIPGMVAYKMINTLDSMIGYKNERYHNFGYLAAKIDDLANYLPARLTAFLMLVVNKRTDLTKTVFTEGQKHTSPNSGYPEAALALLLGIQFGGSHYYSGKLVHKPTIGTEQKDIDSADLAIALQTNRNAESLFMLLITLPYLFIALV